MGPEKLFLDLFENSNDLIQSVSAEGRFIAVNPAWHKTLNYSNDDLKSLHFLDIVHPDDKDHCIIIFERVQLGERATGIDVRFITKDARTLFMKGNVFAEEVDGRTKETRGVFRDFTENKIVEDRLRQSELKYRELVELASDVIYKTDIYGNITFINEAGMRLTGYASGEIIGKHFADFVKPDYLETVTRFYKEQISTATKRTYLEFPFVRKDKKIRWFAQSVRLLVNENNDNLISGSISVCRDVTEIRDVRDKIRQQNSMLNEQNQKLREALNNLVQAKIGKKALGITFAITILLFIASEGILDPIVDNWHNGDLIGFLSKGAIALLFKPIDVIVERVLLRRAIGQP